MIRDGRAEFACSLRQWLDGTCPPPRRGLVPALIGQRGLSWPRLDRIADTPPLVARIDYGRWCVDCPECGGAEMVWLEGPLLLWCTTCGNRSVGGLARPVVLPDGWQDAVTLLETLDDERAQNWHGAG